MMIVVMARTEWCRSLTTGHHDGGEKPRPSAVDWLYFGCRHEAKDYYYRHEWEQWQVRGGFTGAASSHSRMVMDGLGMQRRQLRGGKTACLCSSSLGRAVLLLLGCGCAVGGPPGAPHGLLEGRAGGPATGLRHAPPGRGRGPALGPAG